MFYQIFREISQALPDQSLKTVSDNIGQAPPDQSIKLLNDSGVLHDVMTKLADRFKIGWTHYVILITVKNRDARCFYEIEAAVNGWGYRELERQIGSALYERLALSRDKASVKVLATHGQIVAKPADIIKNPPQKVVLKFCESTEYYRKLFSEQRYHHSQQTGHDKEGNLLVTMTVPVGFDLVNWVLQWPFGEVVEPKALRAALLERAQNLLELYGAT